MNLIGFVRPLMISWMTQTYSDYGLWIRTPVINDGRSFSRWLNDTRCKNSSEWLTLQR